jgi:DNA-binding CsgD family transcriptional regulator/tetratricopeptide (TPR) repeat protein
MIDDRTLVDRGAELGILRDALAAAESGRGQLVVFEGQAGIGKTSLLEEAGRLGEQIGARVLTARATDLERDFSFGLVRQLFELTVRASNSTTEALLGGAASAATAVLDGGGSADTSGGEFAVLHGLFWLVNNLAQQRTLVLTIDDLHWADYSSLRFLAYLAPRVDGIRVAVIAATRPHEPGAHEQILDQIELDPACILVRPAALSVAGTTTLLKQLFEDAPDPEFVTACHSASAGNPLILNELVATAIAANLRPTAGNAERVSGLGSHGLTARLAFRLSQLPEPEAALVRAVAMLGSDVSPTLVAELSGLTVDRAARSAERLMDMQILRPVKDYGNTGFAAGLEFAHPVVRAAAYDAIGLVGQIEGHTAAVHLLSERGYDPEEVAVHILRVPPMTDPSLVSVLRRAATDALRRGAPDAAARYLRRCLEESLGDDDRLDILEELGLAAQSLDNQDAARYLEMALALTNDLVRRARTSIALGNILMLLTRFDEAEVVWSRALNGLPAENEDIRRHLHASLANLAVITPNRPDLFENLREMEGFPSHDSIGGHALEAMLGGHDLLRAEPSAVEHARRALEDGLLLDRTPGEAPITVAWITLIFADVEQVLESIDTGIKNAYRRGAVKDLVAGLTFRALARYRWGDLAGAEADARECVHAVETSSMAVARPFIGAYLADILLEMGRVDDAERILAWVGVPTPVPTYGTLYYYLATRARLLRAQGRVELALEVATAAGRRFAAHGGENPAIVAWRSDSSLCLRDLQQDAVKARRLADDEVTLARKWQGPLALGNALRVAGLVSAPENRIPLLREAVRTLEGSPARLTYAKALIDLGSELGATSDRAEARSVLTEGAKVADICGATPLARVAITQLRAFGGRPRLFESTGPQSLSPSERRVGALAAKGFSNRDIAERLFVTTKTIEVHLGNVYRKLGIGGRGQIPPTLAD